MVLSSLLARAPLLLLCLHAPAQAQVVDDYFGEDNDGYLSPNPPPPPQQTAPGAVRQLSCRFTSGGASFDLSPIRRLDHDFTGTTIGGYVYRLNVCGNTVKQCNSQDSPASKWRGTKCNNLGDASTQTVSLLDAADPGKGLRLAFDSGDVCKKQAGGEMEISARRVTYEVSCAAGEDGRLKEIVEQSMCEYVVRFESRHACPSWSGSGSTHAHRGWAFLFLLAVALGVYCGIGVYHNLKSEGKHGVEAIPHYAYWEQVPGLVREGVSYSYVQGKTALESSRGLYDQVRDKYGNRTPEV